MWASAASPTTYPPWPERREERLARLRGPGPESGEAVVADLRRHPVPPGVPRGGVVHRDPARRGQAGLQHLPILGDEIVKPRGQQPHHLALGDLDADPAEKRRQPLRRHLALGVRHQQEAA
jgi:hypothetical protein